MQIQEIGQARGQHRVVGTREVLVVTEVVGVVTVLDPHEQAHAVAAQCPLPDPRVLQGSPHLLHQEALARIHLLRLFG